MKITLNRADLMDRLQALSGSWSRDKARLYICGAWMEATDQNTVRLVATDGHALAIREMSCGDHDGFSGLLITPEIMMEIERMDGETVEIFANEKKISIKGKIRKIELVNPGHAYPDWRAVIGAGKVVGKTPAAYFGPAILARLCASQPAKQHRALILGDDPLSPATLVDDLGRIVGMIMPMRPNNGMTPVSRILGDKESKNDNMG